MRFYFKKSKKLETIQMPCRSITSITLPSDSSVQKSDRMPFLVSPALPKWQVNHFTCARQFFFLPPKVKKSIDNLVLRLIHSVTVSLEASAAFCEVFALL